MPAEQGCSSAGVFPVGLDCGCQMCIRWTGSKPPYIESISDTCDAHRRIQEDLGFGLIPGANADI